MGDVVLRAGFVVVVVVIALVTARTLRRVGQPVHPLVDLRATDLPVGVILFTSTDCETCGAARRALGTQGVPYREVTWELEGGLMDRVGIEAVPLLVVRDRDGTTVTQVAGVPSRRALRRAVALAPENEILGGEGGSA